jgi:thiamine pyrophosphate-dependent acetolactate synthase large subunit-like protein
MAQTVSDFLLARLNEWGVTRIYGYPGDGINGLLGAFARATDRMQFIQARHEEMAAFMAEDAGLLGIRVDRPDQIADAWDRALSADRPALIDAVTDPNVPPLPPHITLEQAKNFASSIWAGDAEALGFVKQTVKDAAETFLPRKRKK